MPSGMVGSSSLSCASTVTLATPWTLGDTYRGSNLFSSSINSMSTGDGGRTRSALQTLGSFAGEPEELGRSPLDRRLGAYTCTPADCPSGWVVGTCVCWPPIDGGHGGLYGAYC